MACQVALRSGSYFRGIPRSPVFFCGLFTLHTHQEHKAENHPRKSKYTNQGKRYKYVRFTFTTQKNSNRDVLRGEHGYAKTPAVYRTTRDNCGGEGRRGAEAQEVVPQHPKTSNTTAEINGSVLQAGSQRPSARHAGRGSTQGQGIDKKKKKKKKKGGGGFVTNSEGTRVG
ncbi:hypothetical protein E2C01_011496 [Portunus trituberculatus]|uniref:Uncharacterized protein n=1 Tax=Portunus trituberculatus TaxID=210409 RepID=A0A5B7DBK0_PORTR|nr:hypothetical protein [Portunus trituberculatus]